MTAKSLRISDTLGLPLDAVTQTFAIMAKRGTGKTHTASVMAEEMLTHGQPIVVYDPTGAWFGLKSSQDGKRPGFPIVVFGGEHADVPLEESAGETIARVIVEKRLPAILDTSLLRKGARIRFMTAFCETLYHLNREPLHFFIDEAQTVAPQNLKAMPELARLVGALEDILLQGRRRGIGATVISPRPAIVNTSIRSACEVLIAMQIVGPHDRKAIQEWTDLHGDDAERAKEMMASLSSLKRGEAWVWSPAWLELFRRVRFRQRTTFDSSATPTVGGRVVTPQRMAEVDLARLGDEIAATVERAKAEDPKALQRRVAELERELAKRAQPAAAAPIEVSVLTDEDRKALRDGASSVEVMVRRLENLTERYAGELRGIIGDAIPPYADLHVALTRLATATGRAAAAPPMPHQQPAAPARRAAPARSVTNGHAAADPALGKCERKVLHVLATYGACEAGRLALLAGYTYSGGFRNTLSALRTAGYMVGENTGTMEATEAGIAALGPAEPLPTGPALVDHWMRHSAFGRAERAVLSTLVEHPDGLTAEQLCNATGYEFSGGFRNTLSALRTAGVLVGKNTETMRAHPDLLA